MSGRNRSRLRGRMSGEPSRTRRASFAHSIRISSYNLWQHLSQRSVQAQQALKTRTMPRAPLGPAEPLRGARLFFGVDNSADILPSFDVRIHRARRGAAGDMSTGRQARRQHEREGIWVTA